MSVSSKDRIYLFDQFSNTVSVVDPATAKLLGVIKLGEQTPANLSPLYKGQLLVHGMGFSPDHTTLAVVSIGSNSVAFIDTSTKAARAYLVVATEQDGKPGKVSQISRSISSFWAMPRARYGVQHAYFLSRGACRMSRASSSRTRAGL